MSIIKYQFQHPSIFKLLALKYQTTYNSIMTIHTYMFSYYIAINLTYIAINMYISLIQIITLYSYISISNHLSVNLFIIVRFSKTSLENLKRPR